MNSFEPYNENHVHSGLRMSLFPNVPPYVKFSTFDEKGWCDVIFRLPYRVECSNVFLYSINFSGEQFPIHVHKLLRWKLSNITPVVVRKVVANSGYRLLKSKF